MRALQFSEFGDPAAMLQLQEIPVPEPGSGQVRLRLTHRPINPSDLLTVEGKYGRLPNLPATPGLEGTGHVDAIGEGVSNVQLGQRVIPAGVGGSWREFALADARTLIPVPDAVSNQTAAQFLGNPVTAWVMLEDLLDLQAGDWVLQTAAGSTLGRLVLQMAQIKGYRTINFVRRREQVQELLDLCADAVICTADNDVIAQVKALTDGKGVKGAFEAVGGQTGTLAASSLRPGGKLIIYGMLSEQPTPIHGGEMLFKGTTIQGFWLMHWFRSTPLNKQMAVMGELMGLMAQGQLIPPVEAEYDLADFVTAVTHAQTPGRSGKILFTG